MEFGQRLTARLAEIAEEVERRLGGVLAAEPTTPATLAAAMAHAALGGGKRLRPALVLASAAVFDDNAELAWPAALALECLHVYSLVHDDMPCMDDDDLRRGRPTVHKVWDEATAVLAGDALQALAFELVVDGPAPAAARLEAARLLAKAAGRCGMVGGQQRDLEAEGVVPDLDRVRAIHEQKTAALIAAAVEIGAVLASAPEAERRELAAFGRELGLAFQIVDDCLDETGTSSALGKTAGKDKEAGKATWPACVGLEASRAAARDLIQSARRRLESLKGVETARHFLDDLAEFVVARHL